MHRLEEIAKYTEQIQRLSSGESGDSEQRAAAHFYYMRGKAYRLMCDANSALADLEEAYSRVAPDDRHLRSLILLERGRTYGMVHELTAAFFDIETAVAFLDELESTHPGSFQLDLAKSHRVLGWLYTLIGDFERALQFLNSSVTLYEANPDADPNLAIEPFSSSVEWL